MSQRILKSRKNHYVRLTKYAQTLRPENEAFLAFLKDWTSTPDDMGEEWWTNFDNELNADRLSFDRYIY